jgi:hypothetical protein
MYAAIRAEDDEEPDRQEEVDTPDGKPTAEWLIFRKHLPYMMPLEKTDVWGKHFEPSFDEVALFNGRIKDYKRRDAECVGIVKCKIKIFRKEDETISGKAKADTSRDPQYFEVDADDPSISDALEFARPYRQYNIYETYPEAIVEVRAYCLKAFQVCLPFSLSLPPSLPPSLPLSLNTHIYSVPSLPSHDHGHTSHALAHTHTHTHTHAHTHTHTHTHTRTRTHR